jgi:hypothetical protein
MSIHRSHLARAALSLLFFAGSACGGGRTESKEPATVAAAQTTPIQPSPRASAPSSGAQGRPPSPQRGIAPPGRATGESANPGDEGDAELVVSRDVVMRCPTLRLVREHIGEFDQDMVWLAVLESIADCMSQSGPMGGQAIGVSGDEEHRHVIREVLGSRGVAPTRVIAKQVTEGAAECQGGTDCSKRVEITIVAP